MRDVRQASRRQRRPARCVNELRLFINFYLVMKRACINSNPFLWTYSVCIIENLEETARLFYKSVNMDDAELR